MDFMVMMAWVVIIGVPGLIIYSTILDYRRDRLNDKYKVWKYLELSSLNPMGMEGYTAKLCGGYNSQEFRKMVAMSYYPYIYGEERGIKKAQGIIIEDPKSIVVKYIKECEKRNEPAINRLSRHL